MERHKTTQSHANGTTMGRFPRLTPVRLSPQVPDRTTVSSLLPYIIASTQGGGRAAAAAGELRPSTNGAQVLERTELVRAVGCFQTTLAQVLGKCKSVCTCLPFALLSFGLLPGRVELSEPKQVSVDAPIIKLSCRLCNGVERGRRSQQDALQPYGERLDRFRRGTGLSVDFDDVWGVARAVVFGEASHRTLLQLFDPLDLPLKAVADVDGEPWILGVEDIPLGASLEGVGVGFDQVFKSVDSGVELSHFSSVVVLPLLDCFEQGFGNALQGIGVEVGAAVEDVSSRAGRDRVVGESVTGWNGDRRW